MESFVDVNGFSEVDSDFDSVDSVLSVDSVDEFSVMVSDVDNVDSVLSFESSEVEVVEMVSDVEVFSEVVSRVDNVDSILSIESSEVEVVEVFSEVVSRVDNVDSVLSFEALDDEVVKSVSNVDVSGEVVDFVSDSNRVDSVWELDEDGGFPVPPGPNVVVSRLWFKLSSVDLLCSFRFELFASWLFRSSNSSSFPVKFNLSISYFCDQYSEVAEYIC